MIGQNNKKTWVTCKGSSCKRLKHIDRVCICGYVEDEAEETEEVKE